MDSVLNTKLGIKDLVPVIYITSAFVLATCSVLLQAFLGPTAFILPIVATLLLGLYTWLNRKYKWTL